MSEGLGTLMEFQLYAGPADGVVLPFPLKDPGSRYLVRMPRGKEIGGWEVLSYRFANRTDDLGRWVLEFDCHVGFQGAEESEIRKEEGGA